MNLPDTHKDLIEKPIVSVFASSRPDGKPHVVAVWRLYEDGHIFITTDQGGQKVKNVRQNKSVSVFTIDPEDPYRTLDIRGEVVEIAQDTNTAMLDKISKFYTGKAYYGELVEDNPEDRAGSLYIKIKPLEAVTFGGN
jgi:PPOX class probable F420-dependent enzyme